MNSQGEKRYSLPPFALPLLPEKGDDSTHEFYRQREPDANSEVLIEILMDENRIDRDTAISVLATILEHRAKIPGYGRGGSDSAEVRKPLERLHDIEERVFRHYQKYVFEHRGEEDMAWRGMMLLLDFKLLAGADSVEGLVKVCGGNVTQKSQYSSLKQTVNKCLASFQKVAPELPKIPGQRGYVARKKMQNAQKKIWNGTKK